MPLIELGFVRDRESNEIGTYPKMPYVPIGPRWSTRECQLVSSEY